MQCLSASLWGCELKYFIEHPVSAHIVSASLWGCELKFQNRPHAPSGERVSLLVRLWVEIKLLLPLLTASLSASLWGCELKYWLIPEGICARSVSLLVRLWVEIPLWRSHWHNSWSASLWGCELKFRITFHNIRQTDRQPPCEAVSWNIQHLTDTSNYSVSLLVRLWVEICRIICGYYNLKVSLLVRLWVEMHLYNPYT